MTEAFGPQICKAKKRPEPKALGRLKTMKLALMDTEYLKNHYIFFENAQKEDFFSTYLRGVHTSFCH